MEYIILNNVQTIFTLLTSDVIATAINDTSGVILSLLTDNCKNYPDLLEILRELDLIYKLEIIKSFILLIPKKYEKIKCIKIALNGINDIINNIYKILIEIINIINYHKLKVLSYIRKINYKNELKELKKLCILLENRSSMLFNILKLIK
jgi:hypothetical protein